MTALDDTTEVVDRDGLRRRELADQIDAQKRRFKATLAGHRANVAAAREAAEVAKAEWERRQAEVGSAERAMAGAGDTHQRAVDSLRGQLRRTADPAIAAAIRLVRRLQDQTRDSFSAKTDVAKSHRVVASCSEAISRLGGLLESPLAGAALMGRIDELVAGAKDGTLAG